MQEAFHCSNRKDALEYIHKADKLQQAINALEHPEPKRFRF